jgi:NitT/TauT family transport system substrate-binding protein
VISSRTKSVDIRRDRFDVEPAKNKFLRERQVIITRRRALVGGAALLSAPPLIVKTSTPVRAEEGQIRIVRQPGMGHLPLILMTELKLLEKHLKAAGLDKADVSMRVLSGSTATSDAVISSNADITSGSLTSLLTLWDKTKGKYQALSAITTQPMQLDAINPAVKSIADLTENDRIGLPGVKTSYHAIVLQMEAARLWGMDQFSRLDHLTVFVSPPDGLIAMLSGRSQITAHFTSAPFMYQEKEGGKSHKILDSYDVLGGPHVFGIMWGATAFFEKNPVTTKALIAAVSEVMELLKNDPRGMAQAYIKADNLNLSLDFVEGMLRDPQNIFELAPRNSLKFAEFKNRIGLIKTKPASWKDYFAPAVHDLQGS